MVYSLDIANKVAKYLLEIKAIKLCVNNSFVWASGKQAPIYCDNRISLSYPLVRNFFKDSFMSVIQDKFPQVEAISGVATAGIPHGVLIADAMQLPFCYVRSKPKQHGMKNLIEGSIKKGAKVVVVEDLLSTGGSSLVAIEALKMAHCEVIGLVAIFSYGFHICTKNLETINCPYFTLSNYPTMIKIALQENYISAQDSTHLLNWYQQ